eukprot:6437033-Pyramimonas_sp.AAC.1
MSQKTWNTAGGGGSMCFWHLQVDACQHLGRRLGTLVGMQASLMRRAAGMFGRSLLGGIRSGSTAWVLSSLETPSPMAHMMVAKTAV